MRWKDKGNFQSKEIIESDVFDANQLGTEFFYSLRNETKENN